MLVDSHSVHVKEGLTSDPWISLLSILRCSDELSLDQLLRSLTSLPLEQSLKSCLVSAAQGKVDFINDWLFSLPIGYTEPIVWLAPVKDGRKSRYVWMIGFQSELTQDVISLFNRANAAFVGDYLLQQKELPLPVSFVVPVEISPMTNGKDTEYDRFAVFQTGRDPRNLDTRSDYAQKFVLNAKYLVEYRRKVIARARSLGVSSVCLDALDEQLPLLAHIHAEGHNRGHFMGPWPLDYQKKQCLLYESLEEFRACATVIRQAELMKLPDAQVDALALGIFLVRFLGYGLDAYCTETKRRTSVREITVGAMFFEMLVDRGVQLTTSKSSVRMEVDASLIRRTLISCLAEIHCVEHRAVQQGYSLEVLRELARCWYGVAFPEDGNYSSRVLALYGFFT